MTVPLSSAEPRTDRAIALPAARLLPLCREALAAARAYGEAARQSVARLVTAGGRIDNAALDRHQFAAHALAWTATYVEALAQMLAWGQRLEADGKLGETETLILQAAYGEYLAQLAGGIALSQGEVARHGDMGLPHEALRMLFVPAASELIAMGNSAAARERLAQLIDDGQFGDPGLGDETLEAVRSEFHRFAEAAVTPHAHGWHLKNELIPLAVIEQLAALGVFGLTVPEEHGGLAMNRIALCVVTEELSRGYIGVGSLGTRSEIAAELIRLAGTEAQKRKFLPRLASGELLPTAVFTEPNTGSDLGALRTRAVRATRDGKDVYLVTGNKTWITHAARSDMMTLLARTDPEETGWKGLSMFLAEKPRGTDADPFPAPGMSGGEIGVLGYRGMKEYELAFDEFVVPAENLLGGVEGQGFKQLMQTFETARIQTAARAVGVAQNAMELALAYARDRRQFGKSIREFPRVGGKIAWMAVETMVARQLAHFAAREKDSGRRCDREAGMAKLLAARVAWSNADNALQIHGGNGYALEYPISRVLCDARILNIFEGAAEIQAQVIARGILDGRN
ncbi:MAG TPA: acyl-CoA dehydrogenase family protein [Alphaproteobacteria bacterium]